MPEVRAKAAISPIESCRFESMPRNATPRGPYFAANSASRGPYSFASGHSVPTKATTTMLRSLKSWSEYSFPRWLLSEKSLTALPI